MIELQRKYIWFDENTDHNDNQLKTFQFLGFDTKIQKATNMD